MTEAKGDTGERHPDPKQYWLHRRAMAYISIGALICIGILAVSVDLSEGSAMVLQTLSWVFGTVIILYYSNNAAVEVTSHLRGGK